MDEVTIARIYLAEHNHLLNKIIKCLKEQQQVRGFTVFRAISGLGPSGKELSANIIDLAFDLPLVIEFFDNPHKIEVTIHELQKIVKPEHIVAWKGYRY